MNQESDIKGGIVNENELDEARKLGAEVGKIVGAATVEGMSRTKTLADRALEEGDNIALRKIVDDKCSDIEALANGLIVIGGLGKRDEAGGSVVLAMRDVSIAAIELAKFVATQNKK